jgi:hypothetical protein
MSRTLTKSAVGIVAILLAAVSAALLTASPSQADPKKLQVSSTGAAKSWSDNLETPLFEGKGPFVPRDRETATFWLKNNSQQPARATLAVVNRGSLNDFEQALTFDYQVGTTGTTAVPVYVDSKTKCKTYVTGRSIAPGESQQVDVTLNFADAEGQSAQGQQATVDFVLTLNQVGPKGKVDVCGVQAFAEPYTECKAPNAAVVTLIGKQTCPVVKGVEAVAGSGAGTEVLGATGAARSLGTVLIVGFAALVTGAGLIAVRRRPDED